MRETNTNSKLERDIEKFTLDLRRVSDVCGHTWAYPPAVGAFPASGSGGGASSSSRSSGGGGGSGGSGAGAATRAARAKSDE